MKLGRGVLYLAVMLGMTALPAVANVIYNNGVPDLQAGWLSDAAGSVNGFYDYLEAADDFVLGSAVLLTDVHWWGAYATSNTPETDSFTIRLFEDDGGVPQTTHFYEESGLTGNRVGTGTSIGPFDVYEYSADITPIVLAGGVTYWISIVNDTANDLDDAWYWAQAAFPGNAVQRDADGGSWTHFTNSELAFHLTGAREVVPEPASMVLLGLGLVGLIARTRKK
jgi:hypothetical protein